ncbi:hypothetical protein N7365_19560 [Pseudomonas sediminis]|uniref:hypothetical protein n=1 Tax=Pseudomonas TaxID=286 RepID=UPI000B82CB32|nr:MULTISPECIES: hypothetical protein [Pseudomonas]MDG9760291.1 hypothetical protein [Pseudomonas sediminis]
MNQARMDTRKTQEEQNNGERSAAAETRRAEWCMVNALSSLLFCADILAGICRMPMQITRQFLIADL